MQCHFGFFYYTEFVKLTRLIRMRKVVVQLVFILLVLNSCNRQNYMRELSNNDGVQYYLEQDANLVLDVHLSRDSLVDLFSDLLKSQFASQAPTRVMGFAVDIQLMEGSDLFLEGRQVTSHVPVTLAMERQSLMGPMALKAALILQFQTTLEFDSSNIFITATHLKDYSWVEKPRFSIGGSGMGIGILAAIYLKLQKSRLEKAIDSAVRYELDLPLLTERLGNYLLETPILPSSSSNGIYIMPEHMVIAPFITDESKVMGQFNMKFRALIEDTKRGGLTRRSNASIAIEDIDHEISEMRCAVQFGSSAINFYIERYLVGQEYEGSNRTVRLRQATVELRATDLLFKMALEGDFNGEIQIKGTPYYDAAADRVELKDFEFDIRSQKLLEKAGLLFVKTRIKESFRNMLSMGVQERMEGFQVLLDGYLDEAGDKYGIDARLNLAEIKLDELEVESGLLLVAFAAKANCMLEIQNPKALLARIYPAEENR